MDGRFARRAILFAACAACAVAGPPPADASQPPAVGEARSAAPHLLLIHGGSFLGPDPLFESRTAAPAVAAGFVPHYLEYPLADLLGAVRAAREEAAALRARYGAAVYAYGSSAGGTLAALLAGDGLVSAAVAKAPPTDLPAWSWPLETYGDDYFERIGAGPAAARLLSPLRRPARRPLMLVHGVADRVVPIEMSEAFDAKFRRVHLLPVPGGHWTERSRPWILSTALGWLARLDRHEASREPRRSSAGL